MRRVLAAPAALTAAAATVILAVAGCGGDKEAGPPTVTGGVPTTATPPPSERITPAPQDADEARAERLRPPLSFQLRRRAQLRSSPGGKVITSIGMRTEFRSPRIMAVARRSPGWVAVRSERLANGRVGWLPAGAGALFSQPRTIEIDLSERTLTIRHRGVIDGRYKVAIGAPGTHTPVGRFAVTDRLRTGGPGGPYGCCILALTARQPNIAQGWGGGDRIAIHGTAGTWALGKAVSHGCVRASNAAMRRIMGKMRLGAPVWIHR